MLTREKLKLFTTYSDVDFSLGNSEHLFLSKNFQIIVCGEIVGINGI